MEHLITRPPLHLLSLFKGWLEDCVVNREVQIIWLFFSLCRAPHTNSSQSPYTDTFNINYIRVCWSQYKYDMHMAAVFMFTWVCPDSVSYLWQWVGLSSQLTTASHHLEYSIVWNVYKFLVFLFIPTGLHMFVKMLSNCTELHKYTMHIH